VLSNSPEARIRQYACLLLKKRVQKGRTWAKLDAKSKHSLKTGTLQTLEVEPERNVRASLCQLAAAVAKQESKPGAKGWRELEAFILATRRALAMQLVFALVDAVPEQSKPLMKRLGTAAFSQALDDKDDPDIGYYAAKALTAFAPHCGSDEMQFMQPLLPLVMQFVERLVTAGQNEKASESMEVFDELLESDVAILASTHIGPLVRLCLQVAAAKQLDDGVRVKAIGLLGKVARMRKKTVLKQKLHSAIVDTIFPIMTEDQYQDDDGESEDTPASVACQTLDTLAVHLPPERLFSVLMPHVQPALDENVEANRQKAAFNALGVLAEGCSEHIRTKFLKSFLAAIAKGIRSQHDQVRNAALYALGQFSEYEPEVSQYVDDLLPILLTFLDAANVGQHSGLALDRIFYALELFCENLDEDKLVPYLPTLMERLLPLMANPATTTRTKILCVTAVGSAASAVKERILPYFDPIMAHLKAFLAMDVKTSSKANKDEEENVGLLIQSMDTLGLMAKAAGPTSFAPALAEECFRLGMSLMDQHDDPDVRKCSFALFSRVASVVGEQMAPALAAIAALLMFSCRSKEGINFEYEDDQQGQNAAVLADLSSEDEDDASLNATTSTDDIDKIKGVSVENAYVEEKERAVLALKDLCKYAPSAFWPHLQAASEECMKLLNFPHEDVLRAGVEALSEFAACLYTTSQNEEGLNVLIPKLVSMIKEEEEASVVAACLEELAKLLKHAGAAICRVQGQPELIVTAVQAVMRGTCRCMASMDDEEDDGQYEDEGDEETEMEEALFEAAGEVIPALGSALPASAFAPFFAGMLPMLVKKTKGDCTVAEKSFGVGALAECVKPLEGQLAPFIQHLMNVMLRLVRDENDDVRNNAIFGLGELAAHGGPAVQEHLRAILTHLTTLLSRETDPRVTDQLVGALCRLALVVESSDARGILPLVTAKLPLKKDAEEYAAVLTCFLHWHRADETASARAMPEVLAMVAAEWVRMKPEEDEDSYFGPPNCRKTPSPAQESAAVLVRAYSVHSGFQAAVAALDDGQRQTVATILAQ